MPLRPLPRPCPIYNVYIIIYAPPPPPPVCALYNVYIIIYMPLRPRIPTKKLLCGLCGFARASFSATTSPDGAESSVTPD